MNFNRRLFVAFITALITLSGFAQSGYKLVKTIPLAGDGKWDYLKADEASSRLFVSHFDRVHVVDLKTGREIKTIANLQGVHGIALAPLFNKGFITNGKDNTVSVFNYKTLDSITTLKTTGEKPDAILYDAYSKKIWAFCGNTNNATVIDPATNKVIATVEVGEAPEFAASNNKGLIYDNLEDGNAVSVIDAVKKAVVKKFPLPDKAAPTGLAMDVTNNVLFSACAVTKQAIIIDAATGKALGDFPISGHVDAVSFDPAQKLIFFSGGDGIITIIKQLSKTSYKAAGQIVTKPGAKTMALDTTTHTIYTTTADYEADGKTIVSGTFAVLVYSKS